MQDYAALLIIQTFVIAFEVHFGLHVLTRFKGVIWTNSKSLFDLLTVEKLEENSEICNYFRQLVKALEASPLKYQKHISYIDKLLRARLQVRCEFELVLVSGEYCGNQIIACLVECRGKAEKS
jgi:hypothetical protein